MDLLEDPEIKETYNKCKYVVKLWEHQFVKKHKRIPSKLDIREATREVRNAYRKYFQLKTAALEQSFMDVDGFDDEDDIEKEQFGTCNKSQEAPDATVDSNRLHSDNSIADDSIRIHEIPIEMIPHESTQKENVLEVAPEASGVWGSHLNIQKTEVEKKVEQTKTHTNLNITKKLFCGSKFSKRNPRKSLSFSQKNKSETTVDQISASQPNPTTAFESEEAISLSQADVPNKDLISFSTYSQTVHSQQVNIVQSVLEDNFQRPLKAIDSGWLERIIKETGISKDNPDLPLPQAQPATVSANSKDDDNSEVTKLDYDSEDIIEESDEECATDRKSVHIAKKRKVDNLLVASDAIIENVDSVAEKIFQSEVQSESSKQPKLATSESEMTQSLHGTANSCSDIEQSQTKPEKNENRLEQLENTEDYDKGMKINCKPSLERTRKNARTLKSKARKVPLKKEKSASQINPVVEEGDTSPRRSSRITKVKVSLQEFPSEEEDAFHTDTDEKDPEFNVDDEKRKKPPVTYSENELAVVAQKTKRKREKTSSKKTEKETSEEVTKPYELEFSIKPRIVVPRFSSIKKIITKNKVASEAVAASSPSNSTLVKNKRQQDKEKLEKKISSGNLNDNFVRIDITKKKFVRGKTAHSFSKYKKAQWRSNKAKALSGPEMDMGGCEGGTMTCFQCGQPGHFARRCPNIKGDGLLSLDAAAEEEECPFPSLEEASKMAAEGQIARRVPKVAVIDGKEENDDAIDEAIDEIDEQLMMESLRLEEYVKQLDVKEYMDSVNVVEPYFQLKDDGSIIETPPAVYEALRQFGYESFRPGQESAVMRILSGQSTLVTLSTGSGKSLCYQLPAYLYARRRSSITLVVSPLVSLMDDQIAGVARCLKAACLHSNQTKVQRQKILDAVADGAVDVLLVSPEAVVAGERQTGFNSFLRKLPQIAFACIDEAHCVSQWSHNFRPSYLMICRVLRESLGVKTILGLTATATRSTKDSIIRHLQIADGERGVISDTPLPDNLVLTASKDVDRDRALLGLLTSERFADCRSIVVYCTRREECERVAAFLRTTLPGEESSAAPEGGAKKKRRFNWKAEAYHAGMAASRRRVVQNAFMAGEVRIVVATVAFGMGIDKSDIRAVVHFNMPRSFESYVQEVGRAGRDGLPAQCHVFLHPQGADGQELRRHVHADSIDRHAVRKLLQKVFVPCSCRGACPKHEVAFSTAEAVRQLDVPEENIATLLCYLELHENKYIQVLSPAYTKCKVVSYGGPLQIRKLAKECPPLAMALALHKPKEGEDQNVLEFPVVDVAAAMGWDSGICKHKLKNLEWITVNNQQKRSTVSVQLSDLGLRLLAPGNLTDEQLDEALDSLHRRVVEQEQLQLLQLQAVHETLKAAAKPTYRACVTDSAIRQEVRQYFESPEPLKGGVEKVEEIDEGQLVSDVHALVSMYRDNCFTGRAVARIFHGIQSPNYPAMIWGRCKFWRRHLDKDFRAVLKVATREIIKLR